MRKIDEKLNAFVSHTGPVLNVEWSPHFKSLFASSSQDKRLIVWDVAQIGAEINNEEEQDGPSEMIFMHGGHRAKVNDFSWNQNEKFMIASCEEDIWVQIWKFADKVVYEENEGLRFMEKV